MICKEVLAAIKAIQQFRTYLDGRLFTLISNHVSLRWLRREREPSHQVARLAEILTEVNYTLEHMAGVFHGHVDR